MTITELIKKVRAFFAKAEHDAEVVTLSLRVDTSEFRAEVERISNEVLSRAAPIIHEAASLVHQAEKEITMSLPQPVLDALSAIKAALADHSTANAALQQQVNDLTAAGQGKDAQIGVLTAQLVDANGQLTDLENQLLAIAGAPAQAPAAAPADGSASADVQP